MAIQGQGFSPMDSGAQREAFLKRSGLPWRCCKVLCKYNTIIYFWFDWTFWFIMKNHLLSTTTWWMVLDPSKCDGYFNGPYILTEGHFLFFFIVLRWCAAHIVLSPSVCSWLWPWCLTLKTLLSCQWPHYNTHQHTCICALLCVSKELWPLSPLIDLFSSVQFAKCLSQWFQKNNLRFAFLQMEYLQVQWWTRKCQLL